MKEHGYLGDWSHTGEKFLPSECKTHLAVLLHLLPLNGWTRIKTYPSK